jgi:hypothetical protein
MAAGDLNALWVPPTERAVLQRAGLHGEWDAVGRAWRGCRGFRRL